MTGCGTTRAAGVYGVYRAGGAATGWSGTGVGAGRPSAGNSIGRAGAAAEATGGGAAGGTFSAAGTAVTTRRGATVGFVSLSHAYVVLSFSSSMISLCAPRAPLKPSVRESRRSTRASQDESRGLNYRRSGRRTPVRT